MHRPKLVCFDMDDTLIRQNSWYTLNLALGVAPEEDLEMYKAYDAGELSYEDWLRKLVSLYADRGKANKDTIISALCEYQFVDGAKELVEYLKKQNYEVAIISGSFDILVDEVAMVLGVSFKKGNTSFIFDQKDNLIDVISLGDEPHAKVGHLEDICSQLQIRIDECVCVGDGANDIELFKATGRGITFQDAPNIVKEQAWKIVDTLSDIKKLL